MNRHGRKTRLVTMEYLLIRGDDYIAATHGSALTGKYCEGHTFPGTSHCNETKNAKIPP